MGKGKRQTTAQRNEPALLAPVWTRAFVWSVMGAGAFFGLWALGLMANQGEDVSRFIGQGWGGQDASAIVTNKISALWHATVMVLCAGGALWFLLIRRGRQAGAAVREGTPPASPGMTGKVVGVVLLLVVADAWMLARHYIKTMPVSALDENPVVSLLKKDSPMHRVALLSQGSFYGSWLTFLFPYHRISAVNTTQAPRMSEDYKSFLTTMGRSPVRMWQLSAVGYVLAPAQAWAQMQKDPDWKDAFSLVYSYNVAPAEASVTVIPATAQYPGQHVILRLNKPAPRFALMSGYEEVSDEDALKRLASSGYPLFEKVLVSPSANLPAAIRGEINGTGIVGKAELVKYGPGYVELNTDAVQATILRVSEKYDSDWKVTLDGRVASLFRVDYLFQGVAVPKGAHRIVLKYSPSRWPLYGQGAGGVMVGCALVWLLVAKIRRPDHN